MAVTVSWLFQTRILSTFPVGEPVSSVGKLLRAGQGARLASGLHRRDAGRQGKLQAIQPRIRKDRRRGMLLQIQSTGPCRDCWRLGCGCELGLKWTSV